MLSSARVTALADVSLQMGSEPQILAIVGPIRQRQEHARPHHPAPRNTYFGLCNRRRRSAVRCPARDRRVTTLRRKTQAILQNPFEAFSSHLPVEYYLQRTAINLGIAKRRDDVVEVMDRSLRQVGLDYARIAGKYLGQFSGGELQRISIARALIPSPKARSSPTNPSA